MATDLLFRDDPYSPGASATVIGLSQHGIILDRTVFYAMGGGQPGDVGTMTLSDGRTIAITNAVWNDETKTEIAQYSERRAVVGKQPVQSVHHRRRKRAIEPPPALVTLKLWRVAEIQSESRALDDDLGEGSHVAHADIETLAGERMHHVRCVPDQRQTVSDEVSRDLKV